MKVETRDDAQVGPRLLDKTDFFLAGKVMEIIDENVKLHIVVIKPSQSQFMSNHHK